MVRNTILRLESLEAREVPAILIQLDYSRDVGGFFSNPEARATMELVATELGNSLNANLAAITPGGGNTWSATFFDPATGGQLSVPNMSIGANTLKLYVGARSLPGTEAGHGGYGGNSISGSQAWLNAVQTRGHSGFAPWGGSISFDSTQNWHFGQSTAGLDSNELDFYSVATHELGHVLGLGTSQQWRNLISGGTFRGAAAMAAFGGAVPLSPSGDHWANGVTVGGQATSLDPSINFGQRVGFTTLDAEALRDLGWNTSAVAPGAAAAPAAPTVTLIPFATANGTIEQYAVANGFIFKTGVVFAPFPGYRGALQQAHFDFDRDGTLDVAVATVGNRPAFVAVISGVDGHFIGGPRVALNGVQVFLAADLEGDGIQELITLEGQAIYVHEVTAGGMTPDRAYAAFGVAGRAALNTDGGLDRNGYDDTIAADTAEEAAAPAAYTVSTDPVRHNCTCGGCAALANLGGDDHDHAAWEDDLMPTVRVA